MVDELAIEMQGNPKKPSFWRSASGLAIIVAIICVLLAACFSWWLANGTVTSIQARMDTLVYTVEPQYPIQLNEVLVHGGQTVQSGQVIATVRPTALGGPTQAQGNANPISDRLNSAQNVERQLAARVAQARNEEERLRKIYQDRVTDHVRVQLALRSLDRRNQAAWQQASEAEIAARRQMQAANDEFEQASRARAAMDVELNRIRAQLQRSRQANPGALAATEAASIRNAPTEDLYAPVTGRVMQVYGNPGQYLEKGQPVLALLPTGDDYATSSWIQAWFSPEAARNIEPGQQAIIRFGEGKPVKGKVESVGEAVKTQGQLAHGKNYVPVKLLLDDPFTAIGIEPGTSATCQIQTHYLLGYTFFNQQ